MPPAVSAAGNLLTGAITIAVLVVITAIVMPLMRMPTFLYTPFYRADRAVRINRRSTVMPMGGNRHDKEK